jgi:NAD-dependent SIR2 family protein deacetylase
VLNSKGEMYRNEVIEAIKYIKIHGSINWFRCLKCGTLQICEAAECGQYLFDDNLSESCIKCGKNACGSNVQVKPEIITPTMMKLINSQLYNNLWQNAAYELQQADKVIFCGYSLPIADFEFRYLLKQNISSKAQIDVVLYKNDIPTTLSNGTTTECFLPERRYKDLFANNDCKFYYDGFGNYFTK